MKLSAFTSFSFSDSLENTILNIEHYFNWFSMTRDCNLAKKRLSRAQIFELLAASHGYKSYASFRAINDKASLSTLNTDNFSFAVDHVTKRMIEILGVSNKLFAEILVASLNRSLVINSRYDFKIDTSNLICFYIKNYGDSVSSGIPKLIHIYMMALNNIGLSIGLDHTSLELNPLVYRHFIADSKSPLTDILRIKHIEDSTHHTVKLSVKLSETKWANLSNAGIGNCINENSLKLSKVTDKISVSRSTMQYLRDFLNSLDQHKELMPNFAESKFYVLSTVSRSLENITDFLENKLSYSFTARGEKGVYACPVDERTIEFLDTFIVIFVLSNKEITLDIEIAAYTPTEIHITESGLTINPIFNKCTDFIAKVSVTTNDYGNVVLPDVWIELDMSDIRIFTDLYGKILPEMKKAKYLYACAMDNILSE